MNHPRQPVVRVSWQQAAAFCRWLSRRTGEKFSLPTEAQWEWACRAGSDKPFFYGDFKTDFAPWANLADKTLGNRPRDGRFSDGATAPVTMPSPASPSLTLPTAYFSWPGALATIQSSSNGTPGSGPMQTTPFMNHGGFARMISATWKPIPPYAPNSWGLCNTHGNVAEWTATMHRPYPYDEHDGRNEDKDGIRKVARGGSCFDVPEHCTAGTRTSFWSWQGVHNVGFRVVCELTEK
jgi:formylglycine-generating enzyme required for sulfatase activity